MATNLSSVVRNWQHRWRAIRTIEKRNSQATFFSIGIYITVAVALFSAALALNNTVRSTDQNDALVALQPLSFAAIFLCTALVSIYIALTSALSASRERDLGTLEVLFYGPVDEASFVLGKFLAQVKVYAVVSLIVLVWTNVITWLLNIAFSLDTVFVLLTSIFVASAVIAFGLMVAMIGGKARSALIAFIVTVLVLVGLQIADVVVTTAIQIPENATLTDPVLVIRTALGVINSVVRWISPYAQLQLGMDALAQGVVPSYLFHVGITIIQTVIMLVISILVLRKKGARG
ncbi:MAG: ABC transporter permease subunit [Anaerolineae bacterium]|nr:ABC transporter permease subunit [Anaerolineae bacterium]